MEVVNPSGAMTSGLTAKLLIPQPKQFAHNISPSLLILSDQGHLGIKGITPDNKVVFHNINILKAENTGIWITGLEEETQVITVGQGYVEYGEEVNPVYKKAEENKQDSTTGSNEPSLINDPALINNSGTVNE